MALKQAVGNLLKAFALDGLSAETVVDQFPELASTELRKY
jgi:hypothetical protein